MTAAGAIKPGDRAAASAILRAAVASGRVDVVAEALSYHPDVNGQNESGDTALMVTSTGPHPNLEEDDNLNGELAMK